MVEYSVGLELFCAGQHWEDGEPMIGEVIYFVAMDSKGRRFRGPGMSLHHMSEEIDGDYEPPVLIEKPNRGELEAQWEAEAAAMSGPIPDNWFEIEPAYGSPYWDAWAIYHEDAEERGVWGF